MESNKVLIIRPKKANVIQIYSWYYQKFQEWEKEKKNE